MVAQKFGSSDPDVKSKGSKENRDKQMQPASAKVPTTGMVGGISNRVSGPGSKKSGPTMSFKDGGKVEGGFRNAAMEHKR